MSNRYHVRRRRSRRTPGRKGMIRCAIVISGAAVFIIIVCILVSLFTQGKKIKEEKKVLPQITIQTKLLEPNKFSRPQIKLKKIKGVVVHYTANPGTDAMDNRNYFNNLPRINQGKKNPTYASSHFVIGLTGEIVQCIPLEEIAYASKERNYDTISIECCHPDKTGKFNEVTFQALLELVSYLCIRYDLGAEDVIRHYDVTGKLCPLYYVKHGDKWNEFLAEIENQIKNGSKNSNRH